MERTEDQIVARESKVTLGGKEYEIKPGSINHNFRWRKRFYAEFSKATRPFLSQYKPGLLARLMGKDETGRFLEGLRMAFLEMPEILRDLFFAYAPYLPRKEIEENANELELAEAYKEVMRLAFPFLDVVKTLVGLANLQPLEKPTSSPSTSGGATRAT